MAQVTVDLLGTIHKYLLILGIIMVILSPSDLIWADDGDSESAFHVGGALRFNYRYMDWEDEEYARVNKTLGGEFLLDTYRLNVDGTYGSLNLSLEYRFYSGYHMLHHGYIKYDFNSKSAMMVGIHQAPFGIQPYASHNWFFSLAYYLGLEDDYDAGFQFIHKDGPWDFRFAYFKGSEGSFTGSSDASSRYSYDIVDESYFGMKSNNREAHQFNLRVARKFNHGEKNSTEVGLSGQYGFLYNSTLDSLKFFDSQQSLYIGDTNPWGYHSAVAIHLDGNYGRFDLKASAIYLDHKPKTVDASNITATGVDIVGEDYGDSLVVFGAYDFPYTVASRGVLLSIGPAYTVPVQWGSITSLQFYNDFSMYKKSHESFLDSYHNVTGVMITAGKLYTYVDVAQGKNNPWLGEYTGLGPGVIDAEWKMRFNVNFGYYF